MLCNSNYFAGCNLLFRRIKQIFVLGGIVIVSNNAHIYDERHAWWKEKMPLNKEQIEKSLFWASMIALTIIMIVVMHPTWIK